jgi:hypothetical protein
MVLTALLNVEYLFLFELRRERRLVLSRATYWIKTEVYLSSSTFVVNMI